MPGIASDFFAALWLLRLRGRRACSRDAFLERVHEVDEALALRPRLGKVRSLLRQKEIKLDAAAAS